MTGALSFARLLAMIILISHADAMGGLPHAIQRERKLLTHNLVEAPTLQAAMRGVREGTVSWDQFDSIESPHIGVVRGRLAE